MIRDLLETGIPIFGICLGHQMLALALGAKTTKMHQGHHGANHPVKDHTTDKVEIVSMNHGFAVDGESLPDGVNETHVSLFDGSNCGLEVEGKPIASADDARYMLRWIDEIDRIARTHPDRFPVVGAMDALLGDYNEARAVYLEIIRDAQRYWGD